MHDFFSRLGTKLAGVGILFCVTCGSPALAAASPRDLWTQSGSKITGRGGSFEYFGNSISISGDRMVLGAEGEALAGVIGQGAAYPFKRNGTAWVQDGEPLTIVSTAAMPYFGTSVAISGDTLVVAAPAESVSGIEAVGAAYVYVRSDAGWTQQGAPLVPSDPIYNQGFGFALAISGDTIAVGSYSKTVGPNDQQGAACVFVRNGGLWSQQGPPLVAADGAAGDSFGNSVAISGDTLVVGAYRKNVDDYARVGAVYVFERTGSTWTQQGDRLTGPKTAAEGWGYSVAISKDTLAIGTFPPDTPGLLGAAYVFDRQGNGWKQSGPAILKLERSLTHRYGTSVALSPDSKTLAIGVDTAAAGSIEAGAGFIFSRSGTTWQHEAGPLFSANPEAFNFGSAVAASGNTVLFGASAETLGGDATTQGAVYVYTDGPCATDLDCPASGYCLESVCQSPCQEDVDCPSGSFCAAGGHCRAQIATGAACDVASDCQAATCQPCAAGFCVSGVCCERACDGPCEACAQRFTGGPDGSCLPVAADQDPKDDCAADANYPSSCGADGSCDGEGHCKVYATAGTACGETVCSEGRVRGAICDDVGRCLQSEAQCSPYECDGSVCGTTCHTDTDCQATDAYCLDASCVKKKPAAGVCTTDAQCLTGFCADGVCCNSVCDGQCEACNEPGTEGQCVPVLGTPRGERACGSARCAGLCDGVHPQACNFTCAPDCETDADCTAKNRCEQGACVPETTPGREPDCASSGGGSASTCVRAPQTSTSCGCRIGAAVAPSFTMVAGVGLLSLLLARRRTQRRTRFPRAHL